MIALETRAEELYGLVRGCTLCPLSDSRTLAVPGEGPLTAEVMCIGEAPGLNEDKQGRPFVGAAGNFLSELLGAAGLKRENVYICNVLKCRPPANRDPMPHEIEACADYLDLQIDMVDPLVIVTLGRFSMARWFTGQAISRIHGSVKEADGRLIVPMYHPAAALHQGNLRQVLLDDFARLPRILDQARALAQRDAPAEVAGLVPARLDAPNAPSAATRSAPAQPDVPTTPAATAVPVPARHNAPNAPSPNRAPEPDGPWDYDEVEFDPGDHEPVLNSRARSAPIPDIQEPPPNDAPARTDPIGRLAPTEDVPRHDEPVTPLPESPAEHSPAPAEKQQLSLFE